MKKRLVVAMMIAAAMATTVVGCGRNVSSSNAADSQPAAVETQDTEGTTNNIVVNVTTQDEKDEAIQKAADEAAAKAVENQKTQKTEASSKKAESKKAVKVTLKAMDKKMYAKSKVNIRSTYSTDGKILGALKKGASIKCTGKCSNGWYRVNYKGKDAYVSGSYLTSKAAKKAEKKVEREADKTAKKETKKEEQATVYTSTGIVMQLIDENIMVVAIDNVNYTVDMSKAQKDLVNGIQVGNEVTLTYTTKLDAQSTLSVQTVVDKCANEADKPDAAPVEKKADAPKAEQKSEAKQADTSKADTAKEKKSEQTQEQSSASDESATECASEDVAES